VRVDVDVAGVPVAALGRRWGLVAEHRPAVVRQTSVERRPRAAVRPVLGDVQHRDRAAPVRDGEAEGRLNRRPRREPSHRQEPLPRLDCPVGSIGRIAGCDDVDERRAVIRLAPVLEALPVAGVVAAGQPTGVVHLEPDLRDLLAGWARIDRAPDENVAELSALPVVREERLALTVHCEGQVRDVQVAERLARPDAPGTHEGRARHGANDDPAKVAAPREHLRGG